MPSQNRIRTYLGGGDCRFTPHHGVAQKKAKGGGPGVAPALDKVARTRGPHPGS